jgi:hypothetical protein
MTTINFEITGLEAVQKKVDKAAQMEGVRRGLRAGAMQLKAIVARYPPANRPSRKSVYGKTFSSVRQQRAVWAKINAGEIPYRRGSSGGSQRFGQRWTVKEERGGLVQVVANNASYGGYLMGENQSKYMAAVGWQKLSTIAQKNSSAIERVIIAEIRRDL